MIAIDADGIAYVDDGGELIVAEPGMIEMRDDPANPTLAGTVMVSPFQRGLKVVKFERWVNWAKGSDAVAYLTLA